MYIKNMKNISICPVSFVRCSCLREDSSFRPTIREYRSTYVGYYRSAMLEILLCHSCLTGYSVALQNHAAFI